MSRMLTLAKPAPADIEHYDPQRGLKAVAVAETAERHFRRAKDATRLLEAVEFKLAEQRKFVLWWEANGLKGRPKVLPVENTFRLRDVGMDAETLHRWRSRLLDINKYGATLQSAQARCIKVCEARSGHSDNPRMTNTGEVEWYTPAEYLEAARDVLGGFDLDPASNEVAQATVKAARYFTKADDGLAQDWSGRVWLNPPYQQPDIADFVAKLVASYESGAVEAAILLTNNSADTAWFHLAVSACSAICFTRGRIAFVNAALDESSPTQGQTFFYYGPDRARFLRRFAHPHVGFVLVPPEGP